MANGSKHNVQAGDLLRASYYFLRISDQTDITVSDLIVLGNPKRGEDGAHVEVVTHGSEDRSS